MEKKKRRYFITGLLIVLPVLVTVYLFISLFLFFDNILGRYISRFTLESFGYRIPGLGLLVFIVVIFAAGFFGTNYLGRRLLKYFESLWVRFPFVRSIYMGAKQVTHLIFSSKAEGEGGFKKVVLIQYPSKGIYSLGFVTNETCQEICEKASRKLLNVLVPSVPNPLTGFVIFVPREEVVYLDMPIEEGLKIIISGGVLSPKDLLEQKPQTSG
jgi:uncharacterized membrane protein